MKSLAEISRKYSITKAGLYRRINKIKGFRQKYMHRDPKKANGQWLIDDKAVHLIAKPRYSVRPKHYHHAPNHPPTKLDYQRRYERLLKQYERQSKILYNLSRSYDTLASNVRNQQHKQLELEDKQETKKSKMSFLVFVKNLFK